MMEKKRGKVKKRKIEETPKPPVAEPPEEKKEEEQLLPVNYVIKRLRARGEPITLFGETARDRQARLRQLVSHTSFLVTSLVCTMLASLLDRTFSVLNKSGIRING